MSNNLLKLRITKTNLDIVDINGFKYNLHLAEVQTLEDFKVLIPIFDDVLVGDVVSTTEWTITHLGACDANPIDLCVRVDKFTLITSGDYTLTKYLNTWVHGLLLVSEKNTLQCVGVNKKPFFVATLKIKDECGNGFPMLLTSFGAVAKKMSTMKKGFVLKCEVTVKRLRQKNGWELSCLSVEVIQEGEKK